MKTVKTILTISLLIGFFLFGCDSGNIEIEEGYKKVNGVNHFYKIVGKGEPFILLHGGPGMYHDELFPFFLDFSLVGFSFFPTFPCF